MNGWKGQDGKDIRDNSLSERDFLRLPITGMTRDPQGRLSTVVRSRTAPGGEVVKVTTVITRDANGRAQSIARTFEGAGPTRTETETIVRDAQERVASTSIS